VAGAGVALPRRGAPREDRLIFVIMGMEVHPFDRLARAVDDLQAGGAVGEVTAA